MSDYIEANIRCPFYRKTQRGVIRCEGLTDDGSIDLRYQAEQARRTQLEVFCQGRYKNCEIYEAITKAKYQD